MATTATQQSQSSKSTTAKRRGRPPGSKSQAKTDNVITLENKPGDPIEDQVTNLNKAVTGVQKGMKSLHETMASIQDHLTTSHTPHEMSEPEVREMVDVEIEDYAMSLPRRAFVKVGNGVLACVPTNRKETGMLVMGYGLGAVTGPSVLGRVPYVRGYVPGAINVG